MSDRTQVKLVLTDNPEILSALHAVGAIRNKGDFEKEHMAIQHDSFEYRFFHGKELVVPQPVAESLYRQSGVLIGSAMSGTQQPGLKIVEKWELGEQEPSRKVSKTTCSVCGVDLGSVKKLAAHLAEHADDEPEGAEEEEK